ncbi:MAG: DUF1731 domain-containing protein [Ignavibacteriales bacterium]|nr:DUF1731 domain-containing protein [Ignavibacteriales bacterium]
MLPLMALPVKLFVGGPLGRRKVCHALDSHQRLGWRGASPDCKSKMLAASYNLIAPTPTSSADFNRALAGVLHRPYWFPTPAFLLRILLGEMSVLVVEGRFARPKRLIEVWVQIPVRGRA